MTLKMESSSISASQHLCAGWGLFRVLSRVLFRLDSKKFCIGVFLRLSVQVLTFVTTLLPLKIVLFLPSSQGLPSVVSPYFTDKSQFIVFLCGVLVVLLMVSKVFEKFFDRVSKAKVDKIIDTLPQKFGELRQKKVNGQINQCLGAYSAFLQVVIFCLALYFIYPGLILVAIAGFLLFIGGVVLNEFFPLTVFDNSDLPPQKVMKKVAKIIFFLSFTFIVLESLFTSETLSLVQIIIGLVLVRQLGVAVERILCVIVGVSVNKKIINKIHGELV